MALGDEVVVAGDPQEDEEEEDEDELKDPQDELRKVCKQEPACVKAFEELSTCADRVNSKTKTEEDCSEEMVGYVQCVDHCIGKSLFKYLK